MLTPTTHAPTHARTSLVDPVPRIPAHLIIHGGYLGAQTVIEGLVRQNAQLIREGIVPPLVHDPNAAPATARGIAHIRYSDGPRRTAEDKPVWRDALLAMLDHTVNVGTLAAWQAASVRATRDAPATVVIAGGVPRAFLPGADGRVGQLLPDLSGAFGRRPTDPVWLSGLVSGADREVWDDWMVLSLLDDEARGIGEVNTAIARHNARIIAERNLPPLYGSNIRYYLEGVPERWLDAQQIVIEGRDDCEGLAAYRGGELIAQGYDARVFCRRVDDIHDEAMASAGKKRKGRTFHALCGVYQGGKLVGVDDPSPRAPRGAMPVPRAYLEFAARRRAAGKPL